MASPAAIAADSVQPVPWVLRVAMRSADKRVVVVRLHQQVDALGPVVVAALDQHRLGAELEDAVRLVRA